VFTQRQENHIVFLKLYGLILKEHQSKIFEH